MASPKNQQQPHHPEPPFSSAGDHETRNYYAAQDAPRPAPTQPPYLTPYLGLRARLSQTWINRWTILLLLVLIRTLLAIASLDDSLARAREQALSACSSVENVGSAMASMPYYMASGVNELSAHGIEKAINGLMEMLIMTITGIEEIVVFIINLLTQTYICLLTFAIGGSLHAAIAIAEDVGGFLNSTAKDVSKDLGDAASKFQDAMNGFVSDIDNLGNLLTGNTPNPPTLDLTNEINTLDGLHLPANYDKDLQLLNSSIPTFAQVHNVTETILRFPFEEVKKLLNESLPKYNMDRSLFPVPQKEQLTFCSDDNGISDFFYDLVRIEQLAKKIFLVTLIILAVLAILPMAWREMRRFKMEQERARLIKSDAFDPMDAVYIASRPYTSTAGLKVAEVFQSRRRQTLVRWSVAYATTVPALFVLSLALAGLLGCLCQYILLRTIEKEVPKLENQVIGFADKVVFALNNASEAWAHGTNNIITETSTHINNDVFGWVNTTTSAVNDTLNAVVDEIMDVLNVTFGGTVLYEPVLEVLNCLVLLKIAGIENGLTWVSDHAYIDFPLLPTNTFSLGAIDKVSGSEADILAAGPNSGAADAITGAMYHVTNALMRGIRQEAIISTCVLLIWVIIALIGIFRALFVFYKGGDEGVYGASPNDGGWDGKDNYELPTLPPSCQLMSKPSGLLLSPTSLSNDVLTTLETTKPTASTATRFSPRPPAANEHLGTVNTNAVDSAIRRPTHVRASSHGDYGGISPTMATTAGPHGMENPFTNPNFYISPYASSRPLPNPPSGTTQPQRSNPSPTPPLETAVMSASLLHNLTFHPAGRPLAGVCVIREVRAGSIGGWELRL